MNALPVQLLRLLGDGGVRSTADLARRLGITEPIVGMIAEDLARRGYLVSLGDSCRSGCNSCGNAGACHVGSTPGPAVFSLTDKGKLLASHTQADSTMDSG